MGTIIISSFQSRKLRLQEAANLEPEPGLSCQTLACSYHIVLEFFVYNSPSPLGYRKPSSVSFMVLLYSEGAMSQNLPEERMNE